MSAAGSGAERERARRVRAMEGVLGALPPEALRSLDRGVPRGDEALKLPAAEDETGPGSAAWNTWNETRKDLSERHQHGENDDHGQDR